MDRAAAGAVWFDADPHRAMELDDRPDETLAAIARDLEHEARPTVAEMVAERFQGRGR